MHRDIPDSIAIAGIYGFIGSKIYKAAVELGIRKIYGLDPGKPEDDFPVSSSLEMVPSEEHERFYDLEADLFHIALHPKHRHPLHHLIRKGRHITCEKPMAHPENPTECRRIMDNVVKNEATLLYNFLELYNPITRAVSDYLESNSSVIQRIILVNSKDREDPAIPRNAKKMVSVEYQEAVHLLAYMLHQIGRSRGPDFSLDCLLHDGVHIHASSEPYHPINPQDYEYAVNGFVDASIVIGKSPDIISASLTVDFRRNAPWKKWKVIEGVNKNGRPFRIEADYQIGQEFLTINGSPVDLGCDTDLYRNVIRQGWEWHTKGFERMCPDAYFAYCNFALAAGLWAASFDRQVCSVSTLKDLETMALRYPQALKEGRFATYN